jgi:hypothetical protein
MIPTASDIGGGRPPVRRGRGTGRTADGGAQEQSRREEVGCMVCCLTVVVEMVYSCFFWTCLNALARHDKFRYFDMYVM